MGRVNMCKEVGRTGIRNSKEAESKFRMKWLWKFTSCEDMLWKVIVSKYGVDDNWMTT